MKNSKESMMGIVTERSEEQSA